MRWAILLTLGLAGGLLAALVGSNAPDRASRSTSAATRAASIAHAVVTPLDRVVSKSPPRLHTHVTFRGTLRALVALAPDAITAKLFRDALDGNDEPVERQYLIFLAPRLLPAAEAAELLRGLTGPGDGEDVVVALAFNGDEAAREEFARLAEQPSRAMVRNLVDTLVEIERIERMGNEDARDILRSYRALEVLTRRFYFRIIEDNIEVPYESHLADTDGLSTELLSHWLARYPGHPGSDDVAGWLADEEEDTAQKAHWFNRAAVLPDQMKTSSALRKLLRIVEAWEPRSLVDAMLEQPDLPNRVLLEYVRVRRVATEEGYRTGLRAMETVAERLPHSTLAFGWRNRWAAAVPKGLDGLQPSDTLLRVAAPSVSFRGPEPRRLGLVHDRVAADRTRSDRLFPQQEAMGLSVAALAFQFRCWETLAELESRAAQLRVGEVLLRNPESHFPVYCHRTTEADNFLAGRCLVHSWKPALEILRGIRSARASLLSADALAEPFEYWSLRQVHLHRLRGVIREVIAGYESCMRDYPGSESASLAAERLHAFRQGIEQARLK